MNVFLSGPMSGVEGHNRPAFDAVEVALAEARTLFSMNRVALLRADGAVLA